VVGICVLCHGGNGQPAKPLKNLVAIRRREMRAAAKVLGAELFLGEFADAELTDGPGPRRRVIEIFREFRPTLVLAHSGDDYHPDHRAASALAEAASWMSASHGQKTRSAALASPVAVWWMDTVQMHGFTPGFLVDVSAFVATKERMLARHRSQLARIGRTGSGRSRIGVPKNMSADGERRTCFQRIGNPAGGNAENARTADLQHALVGGRHTWAKPIEAAQFARERFMDCARRKSAKSRRR
jgi:LmbE family N-acetylglucosaminyl deacetylase